MSNARLVLAVGALVASIAAPAAVSASPGGSSIGGKVGLNWSRLTRPDDPAGDPTLMRGTAFDDFGFIVGPSYRFYFPSGGKVSIGVGADALYSFHRATGFEEDRQRGTRREATLRAHVLRVPVLGTLRFGTPAENVAGYLGLGPELWAGLQTSATVDLEGAPGPPDVLRTTPVVHGTFNLVAGASLPAGPSLEMPIELRAAWDPFVQESTVDRFSGYRSTDDPGSLRVAFDWQLLLMTGVTWSGL